MWRILCVEDDRDIARNLVDYFSEWHDDNPYESLLVVVEHDFEKAIDRLKNEHFDLVTLDLHGTGDSDPMKDAGEQHQAGTRVLQELRKAKFVPVIFYSGFADRIANLETGVVKVVKKGEDDPNGIRNAAKAIFETGLPSLLRRIDEEKRDFIWDTVDHHWTKVGKEGTPEDLAYLLARRLAARFNRESVKELLKHSIGAARPIEMYIYPPIANKIRTGCVLKADARGTHWIVITPACDFAQSKADQVLLVGAKKLSEHDKYKSWAAGTKWKGDGAAPDKSSEKAWSSLAALVRNNAGDRYRYLPGTFFLPDLVIDLQCLKQMKPAEVNDTDVVCRIDSPFKEELLLHVSRYYGRMGTPDLEAGEIFKRLPL